jgi:hypothetical protein
MPPKFIVLSLSLMIAACSAHKATYPDNVDGLTALVSDLRAHHDRDLARSLALPDPRAWFTAEFGGPQPGGQLAAELQKQVGDLGELVDALDKFTAKGNTEIHVERFAKADDPLATGLQSKALKEARQPLVLYSVRFTPPGSTLGTHLSSFAYVDGQWRFLGRMRGLMPTKADDPPALAAVVELRNWEREYYFKNGKLPDRDAPPPAR